MKTFTFKDRPDCTLPAGFIYNGAVCKDIVVDEMTGLEQHALSDPKNRQNAGKALSHILRRVIQEIPNALARKSSRTVLCDSRYVETMFQCDRDTVILYSLIYGGQYKQTVNFECESCGEKLYEDIDLRDVEIYELEEDEKTFVDIELENTFKVEGVEITKCRFRLPTGIDQEKAAKAGGRGEFYAISALLSLCSTFIGMENGAEVKKTLSVKEVALLSVGVRNEIMEEMQDLAPGPDLTQYSTCDACGHENELSIDISSFFLPDRKRSRKSKKKSKKRN